MKDDSDPAPSILSRGEHVVARRLREGLTVEEIAEERDESPEAVERAIERVREKTDRALATLAQSPFATEAARDLDPETRERVRTALEEA